MAIARPFSMGLSPRETFLLNRPGTLCCQLRVEQWPAHCERIEGVKAKLLLIAQTVPKNGEMSDVVVVHRVAQKLHRLGPHTLFRARYQLL